MNFGRVVRMAIRYKFTFAASIVSALVVAVFWGANIGAVYPVVEVVLQDQSMQQWIDEKIEDSQADIAAKTADLDRMRRQLDDLGQQADRDLEWEIANAEAELDADTWALQAYQWAKPLHRQLLAQRPVSDARVDYRPVGAGNAHQGRVPGGQQRAGGPIGPTGHLRSAKAVLPPHAADGSGHLQRRRHGRPDEPLHQRHEAGRRRTGIAVRQADSRAAEDVRVPGPGGVHLLAIAVADDDRHSRGGRL